VIKVNNVAERGEEKVEALVDQELKENNSQQVDKIRADIKFELKSQAEAEPNLATKTEPRSRQVYIKQILTDKSNMKVISSLHFDNMLRQII
jgi:hypothetical protein